MLRRALRRFNAPPYPTSPQAAAAALSQGMPPQYMHHQFPSPLSIPPQYASPSHARPPLDPTDFVKAAPRNTVVNIIPQGEMWVVERFGKYLRTLSPGLTVLLPLIDKIRYAYNVKEQGIVIPHQSAITRDNVIVDIDGVLFLRIVDAHKASYNIDNPIYNLINLAQTTMRSEIGKLTLDTLFEERSQLNVNIVEVIKREAVEWGVECMRYEIRDITVSEIVRQSMDLQAEAERRKRKLILESEGESQAESNRAIGRKLAQQHTADGARYAAVKAAEGQALAMQTVADATSSVISKISAALAASDKSSDAVSLTLAERYIEQFGKIAKEGNTMVLTSPAGDPAAFTAQALAMYKSIKPSCP